MRKRDWFAVVVMALFVVSLFGIYFIHTDTKGQSRLVTVTSHGKTVWTHSLEEDAIYRVEEEGTSGYNVIRIQDGSVFVEEANCGNQICVKAGKISDGGGVIACIPHQMVISIEADGEADVIAQ